MCRLRYSILGFLIVFTVVGCGEDADFKRGKQLADSGDHAAAIEAFTTTIQRKPNHPEAHYHLGISYTELGRYDEATVELETASKLKPQQHEIAVSLAQVYWVTGRQREAVERFLETVKASPKPDILQQIAGFTGEAFKVQRLSTEGSSDGQDQAFSTGGQMAFLSKYTDDYSPTFSPDGKFIAFASHRLENAEIYLIDLDSKALTQLTHTEDINEYMPTFSPDGELLAFVTERKMSGEARIVVQSSGSALTHSSIYVMNRDGRNQRPLTDGKAKMERSPAFSPDGRRIVFESNEDDDDLEIYVINVDGTDKKRLTDNEADDGHPIFSPDGKQIVFTSHIDNNYETYLMDADGQNLKRLTYNTAGDYQPTFSPDGEHILFVYNQHNDYELWMMDATGRNRRQLTNHVGVNFQPQYSRDGQKVVFASDREGYMRIYIMNLTQPVDKLSLEARLRQILGEDRQLDR